MSNYADIIIDLNTESLDKVFCYRIPDELSKEISPGVRVLVPFGNGNVTRKGYVLATRNTCQFAAEKVKDILGIVPDAVGIDGNLIRLAVWMREQYGSTLNQALKTVLPVKAKVRPLIERRICRIASEEEIQRALDLCRKKKHKAKVRLLECLLEDEEIPMSLALRKLNLSSSTIQSLIEAGLIELKEEQTYRTPLPKGSVDSNRLTLSEEQSRAVDEILTHYHSKDCTPWLLHGITGSGKTEVYMEIIQDFIRRGKQVIMLIPEISLTYQTVMRFYKRFGNRVSIVNSRLSAGEKYDQFLRASRGEVDIMIGPRSALFTPFPNLGLIVIDEEHDTAYQSDYSPKYDARETAIERARQVRGLVLLGSATPSVESYHFAKQDRYHLAVLKNRAVKGSFLPEVTICDLREELKAGNKTIFSRSLMKEMQSCLEKKQQMMLFLNRRGYSGFVSCRSCGTAFTCPHCDISLTAHIGNTLVCHYCGYRIPLPKTCPSCGSPYLAGFGLGTQKVEEMTRQFFPGIRTLRMDYDTTSKKGDHESILQAFSMGEADVLIGTQMIVKGHDFPNVTLVGILAADLSLHSEDYHAAERTFQLLTQASGRAGRAGLPGKVFIQTYSPEHFAVTSAAKADYEGFYSKEILYRSLMHYPPMGYMMNVSLQSPKESLLEAVTSSLTEQVKQLPAVKQNQITVIGPGAPWVSKLKDQYRRQFICKAKDFCHIKEIRAFLEDQTLPKEIRIQYENL